MTYILWIIFLSLIIFLLYIVLPSVFKIIFRKNFLKKVKKDNHIYLTFDDGPNPKSTLKILSLLKKYNAKATFFVTGKNAEKYPELVKNIILEGQGIGCHGYNHLHAWKTDPFSSLKDFLKFNKVIKSINIKEKKILLYRPPYGKLNLITLLYIYFAKKKFIFWDIDPKDYSESSSVLIAQFVINQFKTRAGNIVLLHDGRSNTSNNSPEITIKALELILQSSHTLHTYEKIKG